MMKIAVFTSHVYEPMSGLMQKGIIDAALKEGIKVIFFASFSDSYSNRFYKEYSRYDEGDKVSFDIPDLDDFDGIIKVATYFSDVAEKHLDHILSNTSIPVINIGGRDDRYLNVCCDEIASFSEIVAHLIEKHGCRDIYHLAGYADKNFTQERRDTYRDVLIKHGIPYDQEKVYYGNLWRDCGEPALDYILRHCHRRGKKLPDAVVCANDYSAVGLINACKARGIRVPEDLIITGYDGVYEALNGLPTLTTSRQPHYQSGYQAVCLLKRLFDGEEQKNDVRIKGDLLLNQSCGCVPMTVDNVENFREAYIRILDNTTGIAQSTTNLMINVATEDSLDDCFKAVCDNAKTDAGFKDMLLCLAPDWDKQRIVGNYFGQVNEEMTVVAGFRGDKDVPRQTFMKKDVLPKDMLEDPYPYYIFTIHHLQYYMGYLIVSPDIDHREQKAMQSWFVNLGVILNARRIQVELKNSVERLEYLSNRDMLTEIYNRRGLEEYFEKFFGECSEEKSGLAVIAFDMDDLKKINDRYGHNEGDYSLKVLADAMSAASGEEEICARTGGDEFIVVAKNYDMDKVSGFVGKIRANIADRQRTDGKEYDIVMSSGAYILQPAEVQNTDIQAIFEECLKNADSSMYEEKRQHKNEC